VERWTAANPDMSAEEFIESIPFTETRLYVMTVLTNQVHYRRIYSLPAAPEEGGTRVGESSGS
jgi:soluble lytic murein transglycosylase-like protein